MIVFVLQGENANDKHENFGVYLSEEDAMKEAQRLKAEVHHGYFVYYTEQFEVK